MRDGILAGVSAPGSGRKQVIRQQGRLSLTRLALGALTFGLSLPFTGCRVVRKTIIT